MHRLLNRKNFARIKQNFLEHKNIMVIMFIGILLASTTVYVSFAYFRSIDTTPIIGGKVGDIADIDLRIYVQDKDEADEAIEGAYSKADEIPVTGYILNKTKSYCANNSTMMQVGKRLKIDIDQPDLCYVYYDVKEPDLKIVTTYNGTTGVPPVVGAIANLGCTNATATYNNKYNRVEVSEISNKNARCNLVYTSKTEESKDYLNQKIMNMAGTTQGTGEVVHETFVYSSSTVDIGYRYEGKNPNNYIWFNNELWRIIGAIDSLSHGQSGEILVKIIREDSLGYLAWNKIHNVNDWEKSSLRELLNGAYYNKQDGTDSGNCYAYRDDIQTNCDYTRVGIDSSYRGMIKNVKWYLGGGGNSNAVTAKTMFINELKLSTSNGYATRNATSITGYIGLMYPSDYGYSVLGSSCSRSTTLDSYYDNTKCASQSWLYKVGYEWTITSSSKSASDNVFYLGCRGNLEFSFAGDGASYRPVLYLDSSVYVISGDGSRGNPYIIGM